MASRAAKPDAETVSLGDLTAAARALVATGRYASLEEVAQDGVRRLEEDERAFERFIARRLAEEESDPGESLSAEEFHEQLRAGIAAQRAAADGD